MGMWHVYVCGRSVACICLGEGTCCCGDTMDVARVCVCGPSRASVCMLRYDELVSCLECCECE